MYMYRQKQSDRNTTVEYINSDMNISENDLLELINKNVNFTSMYSYKIHFNYVREYVEKYKRSTPTQRYKLIYCLD